ncbi:MAG: hypothetical protein IPL38_00055 [Rhodobacter sp.]|nr:hypothetical protein [Rhodobacter sp.]MBK8437966.1 hypothetical protein [Rhodobacter sp.]
MRVTTIVATLAAAIFLSACDDKASCTQEEAQKKATDLTTKITEMAATAPEKVAAVAPKLQEIATKVAAGGDDLTEVCKALDDMAAELAK